jgi:hypothetical protein
MFTTSEDSSLLKRFADTARMKVGLTTTPYPIS